MSEFLFYERELVQPSKDSNDGLADYPHLAQYVWWLSVMGPSKGKTKTKTLCLETSAGIRQMKIRIKIIALHFTKKKKQN